MKVLLFAALTWLHAGAEELLPVQYDFKTDDGVGLGKVYVGWIFGCADGLLFGWKDGWLDLWMDGWMVGWMDGCRDG